MSLQQLTKGIRGCACGRDHLCPIDTFRIAPGALECLADLCAEYRRILLVADGNTWRACGERVAQTVGQKAAGRLIYPADPLLIPDERAIEKLQHAAGQGTDLIIGIGSGVINDLCKYVSYGLDLPYFIVATAPSMDGYASVGCALILGGRKVTENARPPRAILAEPDVLRNAPIELLRSGYGDIIGKFSCLCDWKLASLLCGEYFCTRVYTMTHEVACRVRDMGEAIADRETGAVVALMEALVAVGIAMSYVGNSRPASGSEHHLAHFFEVTGILDGKPYFPHGIDVAYSSVVTAALRQNILAAVPVRRPWQRQEYERNIRRLYGDAAAGILALQYGIGADRRELPVTEKWEQVKAVLRECPPPREFEQMLLSVGLPMDRFLSLYDRQKREDAVLYAKDLKDRYTVLNLYYDYFREV